jgi:actin-like ATPase involved in cell morphogenesis
MPIVVAQDPLNCVAIGGGMCLENIDALRSLLVSSGH